MTIFRHSKRLRLILSAGVALLTLGAFIWWWIERRELFVPPLSDYPVRGVDISNHNGFVDFVSVKADSIDFAYIKATEGISFKDAQFHSNFHRARNAGLIVGAYHFFRYDCEGEDQAINLLHTLRGKRLDLPVVIDVEDDSNPDYVPNSVIISRLKAMIGYLTDRGLSVMIYSNRKVYDRLLQRDFASYRLWLSSFRKPEDDRKWIFLQFSHSGRISGITTAVDLDVFNGGRNAFADSIERWSMTVR